MEPLELSQGEMNLRAARGDQVRVVAQHKREGDSRNLNEFIGEVVKETTMTYPVDEMGDDYTGDPDDGVAERLTLWIKIGSVRAWGADEDRAAATEASWYYNSRERWGKLSVCSDKDSDYQVAIESDEFGNTWMCRMGRLIELEAGEIVAHTAGEDRA